MSHALANHPSLIVKQRKRAYRKIGPFTLSAEGGLVLAQARPVGRVARLDGHSPPAGRASGMVRINPDPFAQFKARPDGRAFAFLAGDISVDVDVDVDVDAKGREHRTQAISSATAIDCPA